MNKILTIIAVAVVAVCGAFSVSAQEEVTLLTVTMKDGTSQQFNLPDKPVITFEDGKMLIASGAMSGEYDFSSVSHFSFEKGQMLASIEDVTVDDKTFTFSFTDNANVYVAAPGLTSVALYTLLGTQLDNAKADTNGAATLDISALAPGVYIVTPAGHHAIKIIKR